MKINFLRFIPTVFVIGCLFALQACDKNDDPVVVGTDGFYIVNEGAFGNSNSSISFFDRRNNDVVNDLFTARNGRPLGDQAQSIYFDGDKAYIVVQNSAKIEVIDANDFTSLMTITDGLESPRYFTTFSNRGYVSDWGADGFTGSVKVFDLSDGRLLTTIPTGQGPNKMVKGSKSENGQLFVANSGGYGKDNTISVIDMFKDKVINTITVGDNPNSLRFDTNTGDLWVACSGALAYNDDFSIDEANSTKPGISKIGTDRTEVLRLTFPKVTYSGAALESNVSGDVLYINYDGAVYKMSTSATELPTTPFVNKDFYAIGMDTFRNFLVGCEADNFSSPGKIYIYDEDGTLVDTFTVGIAPNGIAVKGS